MSIWPITLLMTYAALWLAASLLTDAADRSDRTHLADLLRIAALLLYITATACLIWSLTLFAERIWPTT